MARQDIKKILERSSKAWEEMNANEGMFRDAYDYILPFRNTFSNEGNKTHNKPNIQYDSTAMIAANNFVNTMQSSFTPVFTRWAELKAGPAIAKADRPSMNKELEELTELIFSYLDASNFATASAESYFDLGIGTMVLYVLEGDDLQPLNFQAAPLSQVAIEDGRQGGIGAVFRKHKLKARLIKQRWQDSKLGSELEKIVNEKPDSEVCLEEATYFDEGDFVWRYDVIESKTNQRIVERDFSEQPVVVARWQKVPGYATGIGPFVMAMADYKTLNKMKELQLKMAALNAFGVYTVRNNGVFNPNTAAIRPGAFIPVESNGGANGPSIQRLPDAGNYQMQEFMIEDLKQQIRQVMLDNRLPPENQPVRTAFEIAERIQSLQTDIGASYGRLMFEYIFVLFRRIVAILQRKGKVQLPEGFEIDNFAVQVQIVSPIAQKQRMDDVNKFIQEYQMVQSISPELAQLSYEVDQIPQWLNERIGGPATLLRSKEDLEAAKAQLQQSVQQQLGAGIEQSS